MNEVLELSEEEVKQRIAEIFQSWPLYRTLKYKGEFEGNFPKTIKLFCKSCKQETFWEIQPKFFYRSNAIDQVLYRCRNCGESIVQFLLKWDTDAGMLMTSLSKVGQFPPLEERINTELEEKLSANESNDIELYRKALRCRNFNLGLAAVTYLRRVVENRMNDLLDLIAELIKTYNLLPERVEELKTVKDSWRFADKVNYASDLLPSYLKPYGKNPIDNLHDIASDGIHNRPDDECLQVFDKARYVFEFLFRQLEVSQQEAEAFIKGLNAMGDIRSERGRK